MRRHESDAVTPESLFENRRTEMKTAANMT